MSESDCAKAQCPDFDMLSAYVDGEAPREVEEHVACCEECRSVVVNYSKLDAAVAGMIEEPEGLAESILKKVKAIDDQVEPKSFLTIGVVWRYAAAFVVTGALVGTVVYALQGNDPNKVVSQRPQLPSHIDRVEPSTPTEPKRQQGNSVTGPMRRVHVQGAATIETVANDENGTARLLPQNVRHVWAVKDLEQGKKLLESLMPAHTACRVQTLGEGRFSMTAEMQDRDLQKLVNAFDVNGLDLVSATLPQPGGEKRIRFLGRKVLYSAELVKVD